MTGIGSRPSLLKTLAWLLPKAALRLLVRDLPASTVQCLRNLM